MTTIDLPSLLSDDHIDLRLRAQSKVGLLGELARRAAGLVHQPEVGLAQALAAREALGSTGFGAGVALPHARVDGLSGVFGFFARLERPVAFEAIDGRPVDLVFLLLSPVSANSEHLAMLAAVSRRLRDRAVADALRGAASVADVRGLLANK